jgi:hypothetical protein
VLPVALPPPVPVAVATLAPGQTKRAVTLTAHETDAWLRVSLPAAADVDVSAWHAGRASRQLPRTSPACQVAAARRICTWRLQADARGRWQVGLHKRSQAAATVRVMLLESRITVPPPR